MDPYQKQLDALTDQVVALSDSLARSGATLAGQVNWLTARSELMSVLAQSLLAHADPIAKGAAIAAAQVKGEQLQELGPPTIAEIYAQLLAGIAPK